MTPERFLQFAGQLPEATLLLRGDGQVLAANRSALGYLGRSREEVFGRAIHEFVSDTAEDVQQSLRMWSRSRSLSVSGLTIAVGDKPVPFRGEGLLLTPRFDGEPARILLRLIPRERSSQQFTLLNKRLEEYALEIRRRREVEKDLRAQREWLHVTLNSIGDAVIATDAEGAVTLMNPVAELLTGWKKVEAKGRPLTELFNIVNERTRQEAENPVEKVLKEGYVVGLANHTVLIARDGTERPIDDSAAPIRDSDQNLLGVVLVFHDVTDRRRLERQLLHRAAELEEADRRKDEFIAVLAHELRNPLASICTAPQILRLSSAAPDAVEQVAEIVERQSNHLTALVDDLLDVSRVTRGKISLKLDRVDVTGIVTTCAAQYEAPCESSGVDFRVELPETPLWVHADRTRLTQIVDNLVDNACKFTDRGDAVSVRLAADPERGQAVLAVKDSGLGLEQEMKRRLFVPFAQADRTLDRSKGGLGLGLALVKGLVDLHQGEIMAESDGPGTGAEFVVRLPLSEPPRQSGEAAEPRSTNPVSLRILLVEDNRDAAEMLSMLVRLMGHEVMAAATGDEGVRVALRERPDVVLCDIGLPGMSGHEVASFLRKQGELNGTRLIALSGYGQEEDKARAREAGFDGYLTKPVDADCLHRMLEANEE